MSKQDERLHDIASLTKMAVSRSYRCNEHWQLKKYYHPSSWMLVATGYSHSFRRPTLFITLEVGEALDKVWKRNDQGRYVGARGLLGVLKLLGADEGLKEKVKQAKAEAERSTRLFKHNNTVTYMKKTLVEFDDRMASLHTGLDYKEFGDANARIYMTELINAVHDAVKHLSEALPNTEAVHKPKEK